MMNENIITAIVNTLLHSLWQAPLIALLLYILIAGLKLKSRTKYVLSFLSLFIILTVSVSTFAYISGPSNKISENITTPASSTMINVDQVNSNNFFSIESAYLIVEEYAEMIFIFWLSGMLMFMIKFGIDLYYANSIKKKEFTEINVMFLNRFINIAERMGVTKPVKFVESALIKVPVVIGHLKPVILLPLGLVTKIPNDQIEAIISHELAHIIRNDFLHNLIQSIIEIIYFFNPAIYWISKSIRTERENCCDDLAIQHCSDSVNLAKGLYNLQRLQVDVPRPMMAAVNKGDLLTRIKRIIKKENDMKNSYTGFIASVIVILFTVTVMTGCTLFAGSKDEIKTEKGEVIIVKKSSDGEDVKMDVFVTDGGDEDIERQIFVTTTDEGNKTITITSDGEENVWITKDGEKHIIKDNGKKIIIIRDDDDDEIEMDIDIDIDDFADLTELKYLAGLAGLAELDDIDIDIDIDFNKIAESLKEALKEIDKKDLTDEQKSKAKAEVKEAIEKLKSEEHNFKAEIKAAKAEIKAAKAEGKKIKVMKFNSSDDKDGKVTKMIITKDGEKKVINIDTDNMEEFEKQLKELDKDITVDIQVLDDDNDIVIISDSDDHNKKIEKIIIKKDKDSDLSKIKLIEKIEISKIQDELVKDGIIKEKSDELKIFIDDDIIKINDKEIPAEHKDKYKKMLGDF